LSGLHIPIDQFIFYHRDDQFRFKCAKNSKDGGARFLSRRGSKQTNKQTNKKQKQKKTNKQTNKLTKLAKQLRRKKSFKAKAQNKIIVSKLEMFLSHSYGCSKI